MSIQEEQQAMRKAAEAVSGAAGAAGAIRGGIG
jgi:hypothetical protein